MKLRDLVTNLSRTYCGHVGVEYIHIQTPSARWLQSRMEPGFNQPSFTRAQKLRILTRLHKAETFERFSTPVSSDRSVSPSRAARRSSAARLARRVSPALGIKERVLGMAHAAGSVLASVLPQGYAFMFEEFSENYIPDTVAVTAM
jgi:2-oxoglutarate dehydrogenase E1 component